MSDEKVQRTGHIYRKITDISKGAAYRHIDEQGKKEGKSL